MAAEVTPIVFFHDHLSSETVKSSHDIRKIRVNPISNGNAVFFFVKNLSPTHIKPMLSYQH